VTYYRPMASSCKDNNVSVALWSPRMHCTSRRTPRSLGTLLLAPTRLSHLPRRLPRRIAGQHAWMGYGRSCSTLKSCCKVSPMSWHTPCACWLSCGRCCSHRHLVSPACWWQSHQHQLHHSCTRLIRSVSSVSICSLPQYMRVNIPPDAASKVESRGMSFLALLHLNACMVCSRGRLQPCPQPCCAASQNSLSL